MENTYTAKAQTLINASSEKVWEALTNPEMVKEWLFGTEMSVNTWEVGGHISYKGEWQGVQYEDKGEIVEIIPGQKLVTTYWSSFSGVPDAPENYQKVTYEIIPQDTGTKLTISQEGSKNEEQAKHSEGNWNIVLETMKKILE